MSDKMTAKHILERWNVSIKREDRKHENMQPLFEQLASQLFAAGVSFEISHDLMKQGAKSLYPTQETIKHVHGRSPARKFKNLVEFTRGWQESLDTAALEAFYLYYDIQGIDPNKLAPTKKLSVVKQDEHQGMVTEDELNEEDFWKSTKIVTKSKPWLFSDEDQDVK